MAMVEDLSVFFDTDAFATAATYTPSGGSAATVNGIFDPQYAEEVGMIEAAVPSFLCAKADVATAGHSDQLVIDGTTYRVSGVRHDPPDFPGCTRLILQTV